MGRLRCPGGRLSSAQLRAVARVAAEQGGGVADVTTRRDLLLDVPAAELAALQALAPEPEARSGPQAVSVPSSGIGRWVPGKEDSGARLDGVHEQEPGLFRIGVPLAAGRISADQLRKAADIAERHGDGAVWLTAQQGFLLLNVPQEKVVHALEGLQSVGLKPQGSMVRRGLSVCSESDACVEGWDAVSRRGREIIEHLERQLVLSEPLRIRVAGPLCACAAAADEEITVAGVRSGAGREQEACDDLQMDRYDVRVGGRTLAEGVAGEEVKLLVERLLVSWKRQRQPGESLAQFCGRAGHEQEVAG